MFARYTILVSLLYILNAVVIGQENDWWTSMQLYQIYPRSFKDSDGDGIGDLKGIAEKLEHIQETGAAAAWLSPIFQSPMFDFGYDTSDYTKVAEEYGTLDDFDKLVSRATELGLKIVLDFVPNHTSHLHEWFLLSASRAPGFEDFYIWHPGKTDPEDIARRIPPSNWVSVFRGSAWTWHDGRGEYYYHQFLPEQPDLNYRNPLVVEAMNDVLRFWLDRGVAGFRIDAIPHMFEVDPAKFDGQFPDEPISGDTDDKGSYGYLKHLYTRDQDEIYDIVYDWRVILDGYEGDSRVMMMEAMSDTSYVMRYYGNSTVNGAHFPFNFALAYLKFPSAEDVKNSIDYWLSNVPKGRVSNWVLGNHDQPRVASRFAEQVSEGVIMIEFLLPGVAVTYQGEEIGMTDQYLSFGDTMDPQACKQGSENYWRESRDPQRTPFHWDGSANAGFSTASKTWLPVADNYLEANLANQIGDNGSYYSIYKMLSALRKENTIINGDTTTAIFYQKVFAYIRTLVDHPTFVVVVNFSEEHITVDLTSEFSVLSNDLNVVAAGRISERVLNSKISPSLLHLSPYESLVLKDL